MSFANNERPTRNNTYRKLLQMDSLKNFLWLQQPWLLTVTSNYLDEVDKLDDVDIDDDVDTELEVNKIKKKIKNTILKEIIIIVIT